MKWNDRSDLMFICDKWKEVFILEGDNFNYEIY